MRFTNMDINMLDHKIKSLIRRFKLCLDSFYIHGGWMVGILESIAKLNSIHKDEFKVQVELGKIKTSCGLAVPRSVCS